MQTILHKIRNGMAVIGLGHKRNHLHHAIDRVAEAATESQSSVVTGTMHSAVGPVTVALGLGKDAHESLVALTDDSDEE